MMKGVEKTSLLKDLYSWPQIAVDNLKSVDVNLYLFCWPMPVSVIFDFIFFDESSNLSESVEMKVLF
jgi:hypothetical protein